MQGALRQRFHLRREAWNLRGIKIAKEDRADKATWRVIIQVAPETDYLAKFEEGGFKQPVGGRHYVWMPNEKVFRKRIIPEGDPLRPRNLHMHRDPNGRILGNQRTFMVFPQGKTSFNGYDALVVQRQASPHRGFTRGSIRGLNLDNFAADFGPRQARERRLVAKKRQDATRTLYKLKTRVPIKAQLHFVPTIQESVNRVAASRFREALGDAMRTAR
jgi:hypothetical protein